jgi:hypothetical protein
VTSIEVETFPAPPFTVFRYTYDLTVNEATSALSNWQDFAGTDIPPELGGELILTKGSASGNVYVQLFGAYFGTNACFETILKPFLDTFPSPPMTEKIANGDWLTAWTALANGPLDTSIPANAPFAADTFYAKSLMTPESQPMTRKAMRAFMEYLGFQGFHFTGVSALYLHDTSFLTIFTALVHRSGTLWRIQLCNQ